MSRDSRRGGWLFAAPALVLLLWSCLPWILGQETLYLRDVLNTHLPLKHAQAEALRAGELPWIDPYRAAGQPLLGNPNAVPLYPDNLLYLMASTFWALNAHFWLHWLLAAPAFAWLGRAVGLSWRGAWAAGICWAGSGYLQSHLSFYNLIAGVVLAPALIAAGLELARAGRWRSRWLAAVGGLWALLLLAGDPLIALLAGLLSGAAVLGLPGWQSREAEGESGRERLSWRERLGRALPVVGAAGLGTLIALPQLVEFLRILPGSFRGSYGYSLAAATVASWDPRQAVEWLWPFFFGRPDLVGAGSFWGHSFHTDTPAYYFSLYPGLLLLALLAASLGAGGKGGLGKWAWAMIGFGVFLALGRFNPLAEWLYSLPGLRYPVKMWLPVAVGMALLAGRGFEAAFVEGEARARRAFRVGMALLALLFGSLWIALKVGDRPFFRLLRSLVPEDRPDAFVENELLRLSGLCLLSLLTLALLAVAARLAGRRRWIGGAALLAVHVAAQLFFLAPLRASDELAPYLKPPELLATVPPGSLVAHGAFAKLFGPATLYAGRYPDGRGLWLERRAFEELYPVAGPLWGVRYALNVSPEGLDGFHSRIARAAVEQSADAVRLRLLRAWGVEWLLLDRPLAEGAAEGLAELREARPSYGQRLYAYRLAGEPAEVRLLGRVRRAVDVDSAFDQLTTADVDPSREAVVSGGGPALNGPAGEVQVVNSGADHLAARVRSPEGGVLLLRRAFSRLYRGRIGDRFVQPALVNFHLLGLEVPAGEHEVRIWIDRRPFWASLAVAVLASLTLLWIAFRRRPNHA